MDYYLILEKNMKTEAYICNKGISLLMRPLFLVGIGLTFLGTSVAHAQLEEIIVTARKKEESLQSTPISIAVLTANSLEARQIDSSDQLTQVTPNLSFSSYSPSAGNNASSQIFIRGVGQTEFLPTTDPGVGLYIDEVYMARSVGATLDFVDLQQIEILRGPQGTLFGRNTIGGAINITTHRPEPELGGNVGVKIGTDSRIELKGSMDIPISDTFLTRISLGLRRRDGYVERPISGPALGNDDSKGGRFAIDWQMTEKLNLYWTIDYVKEDESGSPIVFNGLSNNLFARVAAASATSGCSTLDPSLLERCNNRDWDAGKRSSYGTFEAVSLFENVGTSLIAKWDFDNFSIKSITAYRDMKWTGARDADNTPLTILHTRNVDTHDQFSQEIQFIGSVAHKLNWLLGAYYFKENASDDYFVPVAVGTFNTGGKTKNDSNAFFGQLTYSFTDKFSLTAGVRVTKDNKAFTPMQFTVTPYLFPISPAEGDGQGGYVHPFDGNVYPTLGDAGGVARVPANTLFFPEIQQKVTYSATTPLVSLSYHLGNNTMIYISYSEGFKGGGFNARNIKPGPAVRTFNPESASTFDAGIKADLFDNTLRLNASVFTTDYEELQFVIREDFAPIVFNAGQADITGAEVEWTWVPNDSLEVVGGIGYINAKYKQLSDNLIASGVLLSNSLPHVPKLSANLGVSYNFQLNSAGSITPRIDWTYRDKVFFDSLNSSEIAQDDYSVINAAVRWTSTNEKLSATFVVSNLTNKLYRLAGNTALAASSSYSEAVFARGRQWSLGFNYSF